MPVRIILSKPAARQHRPSESAARISKYLLYGLSSLAAIALGALYFDYVHFSRLTDEKLAQGLFPNASLLFAAPQSIGVGDEANRGQMASRLKESGYGEDTRTNPLGWYHLRPDAIEIYPGDRSSTDAEPGVVHFSDGKISSIFALSDHSPRTEYTLEPALLSTLFDKNRERRRLVKFEDIPPVLVQAVTSIEDKRFFQHSGFDPVRITKAVLVDLRERRSAQGASTLTQQLAKNIWLDARKTWLRKFDELLITIHLEQKLTKEKIFEYYANQIPLGRRGSFAISGFGEASQAYFGKDMRQLTLPEAATIAGLIQEPSFRNPVRWPERAKARRNIVLKQMLDNGFISQPQYIDACKSPVVTTKQGIETTDAPYFVDRVNERLAEQFQDHDFQASGSRIYTTLDPDLQRDAAAAVADGMRELDAIMIKRQKPGANVDLPQVALICLDPHTGEVKALIGGRNYGVSQLDHTVAKRPSGSIFKPFVYAAALNTGLWDSPDRMTASTVVEDAPKTFWWAGKAYEPTDFHKNSWSGSVTLRTAFAKSLNVPAIEVAEKAGYGNVADLAHKAGLLDVRATPAMALGSYDVTALDMAAAYTIFANNGVMVQPRMISHISDKNGRDIWSPQPETKKILDPRVNFLLVSFMEDVLRWGTGARVRTRGFTLPAAGKTGTSHDAWFAGFTSKLLCIVWVGMDDYQDIKLEGAVAALPIWTDFMKHAHQHRAYRDVVPFAVPDGIQNAQVDTTTGGLATSACPLSAIRSEYYLVGTQPVQFCPAHAGGTLMADWGENLPAAPPMGAPPPAGSIVPIPQPVETLPDGSSAQSRDKPQRDRKGLLDKIKGIFH